MTPPDSSPSTHSASKSPPRSTARNKFARFAWLALPLAIAPLVLAFFEHDRGWMFFLTFGSACVAAPCAGFFWGERRGRSNEGRAARGCAATVVLFIGYLLWLLLIAPLIVRMMRAS